MIAQRIFSFINKETGGLHKAAYVLAFFTLIYQVLGIVRDRLLAYTFGAGDVLDIYYAAFRIPDLILIFAGSIVSLAVIVPLLTNKIEEGDAAAKSFVDSIFSFFLVSIIVICTLLFIFAPIILKIIFPGLAVGASFDNLILLTRIFLLSPIFLGISNLFSGIVQVYKRFFVYALSPIFYNVGIIIGITLFYPSFGIKGLAFGVVLGALLHMLVQIPSVYEKGLFPTLRISIDWGIIKRVALSSIPRSFTISITSIVILFLLGFASTLDKGTIAIFNLAFNLQSVPLSIVGVSYSLAAFPMLASLFIRDEMKQFINKVEISAKHIVFWSLPILTLFIVLRAQIVRTVLGSGEFSWSATRLTAATLAIFIISVFAQSLILLYLRSYYATGDTKKPLIFGVISGSITILLAFFFLAFPASNAYLKYFLEALLKVGGVSGTTILFLPLAFSIGTFLNLILLHRSFSKDFGRFSGDFWKTSRQSFYTAIIVGFTTFQSLRIFDDFFNIQTVFGIFAQGLFSGLMGIIIGVCLLILLGNKEVYDVIDVIRRKFRKPDIILPEQVEL